MVELTPKKTGIAKLLAQIPYLTKDDFFESLAKEGTSIEIVVASQKFYGYIGHTHKAQICITEKPLDSDYISWLLKLAWQKRQQSFPILPEAFRLIHSEADGIPGIHIELFHQFAVITCFNRGIQVWQSILIEVLIKLMPLQGIYLKDRSPTNSNSPIQLIWGNSAPLNLIIAEKTGQFIVKLAAGLMNGLFLDQRGNREYLMSISKGKHICNTFSYTGALSIACAVGGAASTVSVDLSKTYSEWCVENMVLNKLASTNNQVITSDTFAHFSFCRRKGIKYDIIILDPPTFAKKKQGSFSVAQNYQDLIMQALPLLNKRGSLICSTNFAQWSKQDFDQHIHHYAQKAGFKVQTQYRGSADKDFPPHQAWPESNHLKFISVQI
ncbi:MAG: class I SAM-dependent rRNA methyltransferase [Candidatus Abawacabacteria bacterium]|nr:class I SAM-dependent rRNA methyltransferase [Candidatus Abawacabacteria bacterium]